MFIFIDTRDFRFPVGMNPLKLLIESLQKRMDVKEAELSRERELVEIYKKRSLGMTLELHAKEMQIKKYQSMNKETTYLELSDILLMIIFYLNFHLVGVSDEALYSKEVFPETTDEHKGENTDKVEIFLEGEFLYFFSKYRVVQVLKAWFLSKQ